MKLHLWKHSGRCLLNSTTFQSLLKPRTLVMNRCLLLSSSYNPQVRFRTMVTSRLFSLFSSHGHQVRLIDENGQSLGVMAKLEAENIAKKKGLTLVEMAKASEKIEFSVFKLNIQSKKVVETTVKKTKEKEITMKSQIELQDLRTKAKKLQSFLDKGFQVTIKISKPFKSNILPKDTYDRLLGELNCNVKATGTPKDSPSFFRCTIVKNAE